MSVFEKITVGLAWFGFGMVFGQVCNNIHPKLLWKFHKTIWHVLAVLGKIYHWFSLVWYGMHVKMRSPNQGLGLIPALKKWDVVGWPQHNLVILLKCSVIRYLCYIWRSTECWQLIITSKYSDSTMTLTTEARAGKVLENIDSILIKLFTSYTPKDLLSVIIIPSSFLQWF